MTKRERLYYYTSSRITGSDDICIISLLDELGVREISIVCEKSVGAMVEAYVMKPEIMKTSLINVLADIVTRQTDNELEVSIEGINDGVYSTFLVNKTTGTRNKVKASEAVYLSLICDVPIFIETTLMDNQSVRHRDLSLSMALPVNAVTSEMLQNALDKAIKEENYELASRLRDEMRQRKSNLKKSDTEDERD